MIAYTAEVLFAVLEQYNRDIWPAPVVASAFGVLALLLSLRPVTGGDRVIAGILVLTWLWVGAVYFLTYTAPIDYLAPVFGGVFIAQGLLFAWAGARKAQAAFQFQPTPTGWAGLALALFALAAYPLLAWSAGHGWPQAALFGVAPTPTVLFTLGMLLLTAGRTPGYLMIVPLLWSLAAAAAAVMLAVPEDLTLPVAGLAAARVWLWRKRQARTS